MLITLLRNLAYFILKCTELATLLLFLIPTINFLYSSLHWSRFPRRRSRLMCLYAMRREPGVASSSLLRISQAAWKFPCDSWKAAQCKFIQGFFGWWIVQARRNTSSISSNMEPSSFRFIKYLTYCKNKRNELKVKGNILLHLFIPTHTHQ